MASWCSTQHSTPVSLSLESTFVSQIKDWLASPSSHRDYVFLDYDFDLDLDLDVVTTISDSSSGSNVSNSSNNNTNSTTNSNINSNNSTKDDEKGDEKDITKADENDDNVVCRLRYGDEDSFGLILIMNHELGWIEGSLTELWTWCMVGFVTIASIRISLNSWIQFILSLILRRLLNSLWTNNKLLTVRYIF